MGQQHRKVTKRRRRIEYNKRKKELLKLSKTAAPVQLAKKAGKVAEEAPAEEAKATKKAPAKKAPAAKKETAAKKAPAKKETAAKKEAPAKKAPAKKAPAKKDVEPEAAASAE